MVFFGLFGFSPILVKTEKPKIWSAWWCGMALRPGNLGIWASGHLGILLVEQHGDPARPSGNVLIWPSGHLANLAIWISRWPDGQIARWPSRTAMPLHKEDPQMARCPDAQIARPDRHAAPQGRPDFRFFGFYQDWRKTEKNEKNICFIMKTENRF